MSQMFFFFTCSLTILIWLIQKYSILRLLVHIAPGFAQFQKHYNNT